MSVEGEPISTQEESRTFKRRISKKAWLLGAGLSGAVALGGGGCWANENPDQAAELSRSVIGDENTAWLEAKVLTIKDKKDRLKYEFFGGRENPFTENSKRITNAQPSQLEPNFVSELELIVSQTGRVSGHSFEDLMLIDFPPVEIPKPKPMILPETTILQSQAAEGEGVWIVDGLPKTSVDDVLMAKTYIRPDGSRPYASVGVLLLDKRRVKLNIVGGKNDPPRYGSVKEGPGIIPPDDIPNLLVAFNGGFQLAHGDAWGMYANGIEYQPLKNGYASVVVMKDGTIKMGTWGEGDLTSRTEDMEAVRQNCVLLVQNGEVTPLANNQGSDNNVWGYVKVNAAEFITWRSAIGLTKEGNLIVAAGNSLSAKNLAEALNAAGADIAMQLDINNPYVQTDFFFQQEDGTVKTALFMDTMPDKNSSRYLKPQSRDFMYITLDEAKYKP